MPRTLTASSSIASPAARQRQRPSRSPSERAHSREQRSPESRQKLSSESRQKLASYRSVDGCEREIVARPGASGSVLVIDWDAATMGDRRLLAHLAKDEPRRNAQVVCEDYLQMEGAQWCRRVTGADLELVPPDLLHGALPDELPEGGLTSLAEVGRLAGVEPETRVRLEQEGCWAALRSADGERYELALVPGTVSTVELRWCMRAGLDREGVRKAMSLREVIGALESYEPARITASALIACERLRSVGSATLASELRRVHASRIVLNRRLREAVLTAVERGEASMSEIALRCGRVKRDSRGVVSGETTWLARRLGLVGDGANSKPTPWVHTEVLAEIARRGLGVSPREVELA